MNIALLGWGSLLWEKGLLRLETNWMPGGPVLPIEFSRVSKSRAGALTLVIDPENGVDVVTRFARSAYQDLPEALYHLSQRERAPEKLIGYVNCQTGQSRSALLPDAALSIANWAARAAFDAVIWTDLPANFGSIDKQQFSALADPALPFTLEHALLYLHALMPPGADKAREYIRNAPLEVDTPLRRYLGNDPWLSQSGSPS